MLFRSFINVTGGRFLIEGILNPTNISSSSITWVNLNQEASGNQPSFTQFVANNQGLSGTTQFAANSASTNSVVNISYQMVSPISGYASAGAQISTNNVATLITFADPRSITYFYPGQVLATGTGSGVITLRTATLNTGSPQARIIVGNIAGPNSMYILQEGATPITPGTAGFLDFSVGYTAAFGGEQVFSIPVTQTNSGFLDLSKIKEITAMVLPGTGPYPNANEVLAINMIPINPQAGNGNCDVQITYTESQA